MKKIKLSNVLWGVLMLISTVCVAAESSMPASSVVSPQINQSSNVLEVYKSESCGCCEEWVNYIDAKGFKTEIHHPKDLNQIKNKHGIESEYQSCHTAVSAQGYIFEGHVPAWAIKQFLANPPKDAIGLAVPGMPAGSPGMEMGSKFTPYDVLLLKKDGNSEVYAHVATIDKSR